MAASPIYLPLLITIIGASQLKIVGSYAQASSASPTTIPENLIVPSTGIPSTSCSNGLLTFEIATGFIYKPSSEETLAMMPSTLQLTDCLEYCLTNSTCLAINFEMGLCVLLSSSAKQNPNNLYSSQFPVFTIYAEKKCLLAGDPQVSRQRRKCQRAWTFERVAGYEMKIKPRRRIKLDSKESCMETCLLERDFECRSANWYSKTNECTLSDQDRHSVSQSEAGDQSIKTLALSSLYGPVNVGNTSQNKIQSTVNTNQFPTITNSGLYENHYTNLGALSEHISGKAANSGTSNSTRNEGAYAVDENKNGRRILHKREAPSNAPKSSSSIDSANKYRKIRQMFSQLSQHNRLASFLSERQQSDGDRESPILKDNYISPNSGINEDWQNQQNGPNQYLDTSGGGPQEQLIIGESIADYLENNCIYEPNKLCEFRKIQNRILKTVDSIYQDVANVEECKRKCLNAPYRCYSFDYGDTSERVCRTSHLDQASLLAVKEPYLDVVGAITYELASCFNVTIQCRAKEMVAMVSSSKSFKGKIYAKTRPATCVNDVSDSLKFELSMNYHDESCNVRASSNTLQGVFSNDIVIQHHDRIVTTQDVGLSVYCQYDLGNRSITNNVDLAIEKLEVPADQVAKQQSATNSTIGRQPGGLDAQAAAASSQSPLMITGLATTIVRSPNVTMRITNMNGQPVTSATVGDRLALLFEVKEKTSPFGIFVREIVAMDGKQVLQNLQTAVAQNKPGVYHYASSNSTSGANPLQLNENSLDYMIQTNPLANSVQFIDSDGCPTDANIMGPLIRMDPNGHRILAPFDAFKFPTSDMVFFRAVVTSCLADCAPVTCLSGGAGLSVPSTPTPIPTKPTPKTQARPQQTDLASRSTTMIRGSQLPPSTPIFPIMSSVEPDHFSTVSVHDYEQSERMASKAPITTGNPPLKYKNPTAAAMTTSAPMTTTTTRLSSTGIPSRAATLTSPILTDTLTTIPGFGDTSNDNQEFANQSMTNNHNGQMQVRSQSTTLSPLIQSAKFNLNNMSDEQRLQIVKLFEAKLRQQQQAQGGAKSDGTSPLDKQENISDLADLYTGFLASLMLKMHQPTNHDSNDEQYNNTSGRDLLMTTPDVDSDMASVVNYKRNEVSHSNLVMQSQADKQDGEHYQVLGSNNPSETGSMPSGDFDRLLSDLADELTNAKGRPRISGLREFVDLLSSVSTTTSPTTSQPDEFLMESTNMLTSDHPNINQRFKEPIKSSQSPDPTMSPIDFKPQVKPQSRKREKLSDRQALADSYLGAFQSMGKHRKRRDARHEVLSASDYVFMDQQLGNDHHPRFTRAIVELYHTAGGGDNLKRFRRSTPQTASTLDQKEMVVQSIKIVDRLHFEDEKQKDSDGLENTGKNSRLPLQWKASAKSPQKNDENDANLGNWSSTGLLSVLIMTTSFIFLQVFLVSLYIINWSQKKQQQSGRSRFQSLTRSQKVNFSIDDTQQFASTKELPSPSSTLGYSTWTDSTVTRSTTMSSTSGSTLQQLDYADLNVSVPQMAICYGASAQNYDQNYGPDPRRSNTGFNQRGRIRR